MKYFYVGVDDDGREVVRKEVKRGESGLIFSGRRRVFTKLYHSIEPEFSKKNYFAYFCRLLYHLEVNTNRIVIFHRGYNEPMDFVKIINHLDISKSVGHDFLKECIERGYIAKAKTYKGKEGYFVNPVYNMNGNGVDPFLFVLFGEEPIFRKLLTEKDMEIIREYLMTEKLYATESA